MKHALTTMQPGEKVIFQVKRHPIGMIGIYVMAGLLLVALAVICFIVAPAAFESQGGASSGVKSLAAIAFLIIAVLSLIFVFISNIVYWGNAWILTSDSITQINQRSLFDRQSSQLSLANLEDVTAQQNGILSHLFNFGVLKAETAGERSKFVFAYCPNPNFYAQQILQARELFVQQHPGGHGGGGGGTNVGTE